jgi:hypothetical protein
MDLFEYSQEIHRENKLNIIFTDNKIMEYKFKDYIKNLHKSNESITKKKQIINLLIPKIKKYNTRMYNFKSKNLHY